MNARWLAGLGTILLAITLLLAVTMLLASPVRGQESPRVARPSAGGNVVLLAQDAVTHGERLRYEPEPHKNTLGYWTRKEDWCEWRFETKEAGRYEVQILQGCGKGQGGSEVALRVGEQEIVFTVEETGHFQNFKNRTLGTVELPAGDAHALEIRPRTKAAAAVMDVRQVRLIRVTPEP